MEFMWPFSKRINRLYKNLKTYDATIVANMADESDVISNVSNNVEEETHDTDYEEEKVSTWSRWTNWVTQDRQFWYGALVGSVATVVGLSVHSLVRRRTLGM